ncbi:MAG: cytochrome b [Gammaproteobacteria bacterium]|nr:MAG: cytochrome b [Gammaproteobacteria bacterium]
MTLKNTANNYGSIAKWFHWTIVALFLGSYCAVYFRHWFTEEKTPENWTALQLHLSFGITIAAVVILRIIWRNFNQTPSQEPGTKLAHIAAHIGHYALYAVMILMPLSGYIGTGVNTEFFFLFDVVKFEATSIYNTLVTNWLGLSFKEFEEPIDFFHKEIMGKWAVWILILGHAIAALYHHFVIKDRTLKKMTTG